MTEPREIAEKVEVVVAGVYHWRIHNSNIGGAISSSHAVEDGDGIVMVDPVHLADAALGCLARPAAVVLTARCHQRSAWRYRSQFGIEVWLPEDAEAADEEPDRRYREGEALPGGLVALRTPGPEWPHYSFLLEREPGVLFCPTSSVVGVVARWISCRRSSTRIRRKLAVVWSACWTSPSQCSAWITARRSPMTRRQPCVSCLGDLSEYLRRPEAGRLRLGVG
jgi:hypothetical protein